MRILTVGTLYPPHDGGGGYEILWRSAVAHLRAAGHTVRVLATDHRDPDRAGAPEDPDVHRELRWYWKDDAFPRRSPRKVVAIERHNARVLRRHLGDFRPDRLGFWPLGGLSLSLLEVGRRAGVPAAAFVIDDWLDYGRRADTWHRWTGGRGVDFAAAAHYAFVSRATRDHAWFTGVPTPERSIVTAGIDPRLVDPAPAREWDGSLLYVGRIDARKGLATAVDALAELPDCTLTIAGTGPDEDALAERIAERGVGARVRLLGQVDRAELPGLYAAADAVVFPVLWSEPWGLVPLEAMGRGRPVVATGRGGSAEYLSDGANALLFAAGDAGALAACVRRLAEDPELRARLRDGGVRTAEQHTEPRANARVEATLAACATTHPPEPAEIAPSVAWADDDWGDAEVIVFAAPGADRAGLAALHAELHRRLPGEAWAVQGAVRRPRTAFGRWLAARGHPPLAPARRGEVGPVRLDLAHASIKRTLLERAGGVGPGGVELAYRLTEHGLRLHYEPRARITLTAAPSVEDVAACLPRALAAERELAAAHPHLAPRLAERVANAAAAGPARGRLGRALVAHVPETLPLLGPAVWRNATDHYERRLARAAAIRHDPESERAELERYLGDDYDERRLRGHRQAMDAELAAAGDEARHYRTSEAYLYDLTVFAMSGTKLPYLRDLTELVPRGAHLLDYGCGIGSDGLRLLEAGYRVSFADFDNPSTRYLRWRLRERGLDAPIYDLDRERPPAGHDAVLAFDVIEHVSDPFAFLAELESVADLVCVNFLRDDGDENPLHHRLPLARLLAHAARRRLLRYRRYHGRSHLVIYRPARS